MILLFFNNSTLKKTLRNGAPVKSIIKVKKGAQMLYHYKIGIPEKIIKKLPVEKIQLNYTFHALNELKNDRYGKIEKIDCIYPDKCKVIEVEKNDNNGIIQKVLYRTSYNEKLDICIAVMIDNNNYGKVKTLWINEKTDIHKTLNKNPYKKGKK